MPSQTSYAEMRHLMCGFATTAAISAIVELGIVDRLANGPRDVHELARLAGANEDFLRRVLRYLAHEGMLVEEPGDRFALNALSYWLRADVPGSLQPRARFMGSAPCWMAWGKFAQALKSGRSGAMEAFGHSLFDFAKSDPDSAAIFNTYMAAQTKASNQEVLAAYDFSDIKELADIGGGRGALLAGILQAYPKMRGILFDRADVVDAALPLLADAGVAARCRIAGGSFFDEVPAGADAYALKFILHDWPDDDCIRILSNCRQAMAAEGRIVVIEHVVPEERGPDFARYAKPTDIGLWVLDCVAVP
jgi:hypothetical protein